jgi:hypothetical protein
MSTQETTAVLITSDHWYSCSLANRGQRLLEVLNDVQSEFLQVTDVKVFRHRSQDCVATLPSAVIPKGTIRLAIPTEGKHEALEKRRYAFVEKEHRTVFLVLAGYEISGTFHARGLGDPLAILTYESARFLPVAQASISPVPDGGEALNAAVVLANKNFISLLKVG